MQEHENVLLLRLSMFVNVMLLWWEALCVQVHENVLLLCPSRFVNVTLL